MQLQTDRQAVVLTADFTQSFPLLGTAGLLWSHDTAITGIEYRSDVSLVRTRCFDSSHCGASLLPNVIGLGKIIKRWSHQNTLIVIYHSEKLASSYIFRTDYEPGPLILKMKLCNCCGVIYFTENYVVFHTFCMSNRPLNMNSAHVQTRSLCGIILIS